MSLVQADPFERHDVVSFFKGSDQQPLFSTGPDLAAFGDVVEVRGVPALEPGTYPFYCSEHPWMYGELIVV